MRKWFSNRHKRENGRTPAGSTVLLTLTSVKLFAGRDLLCGVCGGSCLNNLSCLSYNGCLAVVGNYGCLFNNLHCYALRICCLSCLLATARNECYAAKNSKRKKYFLHLC